MNSHLEENIPHSIRNINNSRDGILIKKIAATNIFHIFNKKNFRLHDYRNEQQSQKGLRVFSSDVFMGYATRTIKKKIERKKERKKENKKMITRLQMNRTSSDKPLITLLLLDPNDAQDWRETESFYRGQCQKSLADFESIILMYSPWKSTRTRN